MDSVLFPHFYLSNDLLIRHQYLYTNQILRLLSSDRPTRDDKEVKHLISSIQFPINRVVENDQGVQRFLSVLNQAYEKKNDLYFPALQKFGVERTSTKTFHFSRMIELEAAVQKIQELGFAKPDRAGSWCMSTPKMVQIFVTCATVEYQKQVHISRCSDHPEHDDLAVITECLPKMDTPTQTVTRAILDFPYYVPKDVNHLNSDDLQKLRESILPQSESYSHIIMSIADSVSKVSSLKEVKAALEYEIIPLHELNHTIQTNLTSNGYKVQECRGQYRWYVKQDSTLSSVEETNKITVNQGCLSAVKHEADKELVDGLFEYPGCFIWTLGTLKEGKGILHKLRRLWG